MRHLKHYLRKWLLGLGVILISMIFVYFGVKWWLQYATTEAFKGEVNAAIITGIIGIITLIASMGLQSYFNYDQKKMTIRDELFRRRIEVYSQLLPKLSPLLHAGHQVVFNPTEENKERLNQMADDLFTFVIENQFYMSPQVYKKAFGYARTMQFISSDLYGYYLKQFSPVKDLDKLTIVTPQMVWKDITDNDYWPLIRQMKREFGLESIEKEIEKLSL